ADDRLLHNAGSGSGSCALAPGAGTGVKSDGDLRSLCERAAQVGRAIDLTGCYHEVDGPYAYGQTNYYGLLAGLAATRRMRQVLDIGTRFGGSILAVRSALAATPRATRVLVTVDVREHDLAAFSDYPDVIRILGDSIAEQTV